MGIQGLLPFLKDASTQINISELRNYTIAIDSYCWLHKGAFGCAEKLARGEDTNGYVLYCLKYIKMLQQYNITPIMVFDGQHLPAKKATEEKRRQQRNESKKRAQELLRMGKNSEAYSYIRRSIDISHKMALALIKECRNMGIDCIVAPYEADSQLAFLNMNGICQAVISEDSDLVLFGCKKIIYKLDLQGIATMVDSEKIPICMKLRPDVYTFDKFRHMCILSGCDYLDSLPGIGIKKALKFVSMTANPSIYDVLPKLPSYLKIKDLVVSNQYRTEFMIAEATFRHQIVYDPLTRKLKHLTDPHPIGTRDDYLVNAGEFYDEETAFKMALGNIDPFSLKVLDNWVPSIQNVSKKSIWLNSYTKPVDLCDDERFTRQNSNNEIKPLNEKELEQQKVQEDFELQKELSVYLNVTKEEPIKRKRDVSVENNKEEEKEAPLSPVLGDKKVFNPFKKLSKFKRTEVATSEVTVSRFFARKGSLEKSDERMEVESLKNQAVETQNVEQNVEDLIMQIEEGEDNNVSLLQESQGENKLESFMYECKNKLILNKNPRRSSESFHRSKNICETESDLENNTPPNSQPDFEENVQKTEEIVDVDKKIESLFAKNNVKNISSNSKTIYRTKSGLSSSSFKSSRNSKTVKVVSKNQLKLTSMFSFTKPPKLT